MKISSATRRRLLLATVVLVLVGALAFVLLRSGPLAPTRVTVAQVKEGSFEARVTLPLRHSRMST